ncbi:RNA polymerase sigma factor [Mucilaginibacter frigoritolerans]|uniref:RNA polymerase sigma factor n=1 Tax=Mucilaginibacter frigoritolerans TaxID=652788 RepID=UPI002938E5BB|nr:RNA polymerase sigma-70 factor [Mucilaginibacter frigoritolerans]
MTTLLREGDKAAYTEIFNRYNSLLFLHAFKKLQNREEAKDVVQEVFVKIWATREEFVLATNLAGYLYTCIHHKILDLFAHQKTVTKYTGFLQHFLDESKGNTDHLIREKQLSLIIEQEIAALPPKMREVFELSRKKQLSHKEIAGHLGISEETVKSQVKNALKILRIKLGMISFLFFLIYF